MNRTDEPSNENEIEDTPIRPIGVKTAKKIAKEKCKSMPPVDEGKGEQREVIGEILQSQLALSDAPQAHSRVKTMGQYLKLLEKGDTLTPSQKKVLEMLKLQLFGS